MGKCACDISAPVEKGRDEWDGRTVSRKEREEGRKKSGSPSVAAGPASFWPSGANCWPPYPPSQVPEDGPVPHAVPLQPTPGPTRHTSEPFLPYWPPTTRCNHVPQTWFMGGHGDRTRGRERLAVEKGRGGKGVVEGTVLSRSLLALHPSACRATCRSVRWMEGNPSLFG